MEANLQKIHQLRLLVTDSQVATTTTIFILPKINENKRKYDSIKYMYIN